MTMSDVFWQTYVQYPESELLKWLVKPSNYWYIVSLHNDHMDKNICCPICKARD